jgi:hypothetical protein
MQFLLHMLEGIIYTAKRTRTAFVVKYLQEHYTVVTKLLLHERMRKFKGKVKRIAIPLHAFTGLEGYRRLRLPDFKTIGT